MNTSIEQLRENVDHPHWSDAGVRDRARWLAALADRLETRHGYTSDHTIAVSRLAIAIGRRLGLTGLELRQVELGALLHDVGKLDVPETILGKPTPLSALEWSAMRRHAEAGVRMLHHVLDVPAVLAMVRWHHERWDGEGYPDGMRGEQIPLGARIIAVADAFQAMLEPRPYRGGRTRAAALDEMSRNAGSQFDPDCVDALRQIVADPSLV